MPIEKEEEIHARTHRQHAIPQHIGAFKFRLVGQFTLKEFGYLAAFGVLAWIVLASKLIFLIKFPAAAILFSAGVAFAFIPVAGRSLDKMLINFFRSITIPTQRVWIKKGALPDFLKPGFGRPQQVPPTGKTVASRKLLEEYLTQFKPKPSSADIAETAFVSKLDWNVASPSQIAQVKLTPQATSSPTPQATPFESLAQPIPAATPQTESAASFQIPRKSVKEKVIQPSKKL